MRLTRLSFRGLTRFTGPDPVTLDFDAIGPGLVALVGANGEGKTTALEAVPAALYKALPSRPGSLYDHCHGRDAFIEASFDCGGDCCDEEIKVRVQIDAERRTTEGYVFENGESLTTGRSAEFEVEIARLFGSQELFLASVFAAQNKAGNFLLMAKGDRKALFVELLGLAHLEVLQAAARDRRAGEDSALAAGRAMRDAAESDVADVDLVRTMLADAMNRSDAAERALEASRMEDATAVAALERARGAGERLAALERAGAAAAREWTMAADAVQAADRLPLEAQARALERVQAVRAQHLDVQERSARERYQVAVQKAEARRRDLLKITEDATAVADAMRRLPPLREELAALDLAQARADVATHAMGLAGAARKASELRLSDANKAADKSRERLERMAGLLGKVPCTAHAKWETPAGRLIPLPGACPLLADARDAKTAAADVTIDPALAQAHLEAVQKAGAAESTAQAAAILCDPIRQAELRTEVLALATIESKAKLVGQAQAQLATVDDDRRHAHGGLDAELARLGEARTEAARTIAQAEEDLEQDLRVAGARIQSAAERLAACGLAQEAAEQALARAREEEGALTVPQAEASLSAARTALKEAERQLRAVDGERAGLDAKLVALDARAAQLEGYRGQVALAEREVGDWTLLERALGRDGIQALEIDAAGPEVARLTNELLSACYGSRFSIAFETLREKKSKPGEYSEAFDVRVFDRGHERPVEALSGGEKVVVGEAIGLAIAVFNSRKSGIRWETLFRDETAGALDPRNAQAYVEMLRKALSLGGFSQIVFVAHQQEVWERADARFRVEGGQVALEGSRQKEAVTA